MDIFTNFIPKYHYENCIINDKKFIIPPTKTIDFSNKPISIFNDYIPTYEELNKNPYNILIIQDPNELFGLHDWAIKNKNNFSCILTWNEMILKECDNALLFPFGTSFLHECPEFYEQIKMENKKFGISFLCGKKKITEGHLLRHQIYENGYKIEIDKIWMYDGPLDCKKLCWDTQFHISIENVKKNNWFTEKIIDCFLTKTIPIYWGCYNLSEYFNSDGYITFNSSDELLEKINTLTPDYYFDRKKIIEKNYHSALYHGDFFYRLNEILVEIVTLNQI